MANKTLKDTLQERRESIESQAREILDRATAENRDLTGEEAAAFARLGADMDALRAKTAQLDKFAADAQAAEQALRDAGHGRATSDRGEWVNVDTGEPVALRSGQSFARHDIPARYAERHAAQDQAAIAQHGNLGAMLRALTTTGGSAVVPTIWAARLIDLARNNSAVLKAGATIVPMEAGTVQVARLTGDPTAAFRTEGSAITPSDPTLDNVTLTAKTQSCLVIGSLEWFQDADNATLLVETAIAQAMGVKIDQVALYGGITSGAGSINLPTPPNPRGILAALNALKPANVLGAAANGTTQTASAYYNEVLDLIFTVRDSNEEPNAVLWNSKAGRQYAKATDTTGQPLQLPPEFTAMQRYVTNQIPSYTQGTMTSRATDIFAGDFSQLIVGQRLGITLQVLTERYADNGQIGIVAHWRGDVQPARPGAFAVYKAIQGSL